MVTGEYLSCIAFDPKPAALDSIDLDTLRERYARELREDGAAYQLRIIWRRRPLHL